jgi:hypothetical protein
MDILQTRVATTVDWLFAPDWLTPEEACFLSDWDKDILLEIITEDGVDLNDEGLIEKQSLQELLESLALVLHWDDWVIFHGRVESLLGSVIDLTRAHSSGANPISTESTMISAV